MHERCLHSSKAYAAVSQSLHQRELQEAHHVDFGTPIASTDIRAALREGVDLFGTPWQISLKVLMQASSAARCVVQLKHG